MSAPSFPTAEQVARVIVAACLATGDDPIAVASGAAPLQARGRAYAFVALAVAFPEPSHSAIGRMVGAAALPSFVPGTLGTVRKPTSWWSHGIVNACLMAIGRPGCTEEEAEVRRLKVSSVGRGVAERAGVRG